MHQTDQISLKDVNQFNDHPSSMQGVFIALTIITLWASSLALWLLLGRSHLELWWVLPAIAIQTFLYTGLFITAHDAMHRSLYPQNHRVNDFIGSVAVFLYACFSYKKLIQNHWLHHRHPASELDPDFHDGQHKNLTAWYLCFLKRYFNWVQLLTLIALFHGIHHVFHISENSLALFWVVPSLLSSVQLFYFGTFLPHREPKEGYANLHHAQSSSFPVIWSFITCYHFGYHEEHHMYPQVPWWQLPIIRRLRTLGGLVQTGEVVQEPVQ